MRRARVAAFDLDGEMASWRRQFLDNPAFSREAIAELEAHVAEAVSREVDRGGDPQAAFRATSSRLGSADSLTEDYLASGSTGRRILYHLQDAAMKYVLPASIVFAAILLAFSPTKNDAQGPLYQIAAADNATWRLNTQTGELCLITRFGDPEVQKVGCLASPDATADPRVARITGKVYRDGGEVPARGVRVVLNNEVGTTTDASGRFELTSRLTGAHQLTATLRDMEATVSVELVEGRHTLSNMELPPPNDAEYRVFGEVTNERGRGVRGVELRVGNQRVVSRAGGRYEITVPGGGVQEVYASVAGLEAQTQVNVSSAQGARADFVVAENEVRPKPRTRW